MILGLQLVLLGFNLMGLEAGVSFRWSSTQNKESRRNMRAEKESLEWYHPWDQLVKIKEH